MKILLGYSLYKNYKIEKEKKKVENIFRDFLLPPKKKSGRFPASLSLSSASWSGFRYYEFNLTSDHAAFYHPWGWGGVRLAP